MPPPPTSQTTRTQWAYTDSWSEDGSEDTVSWRSQASRDWRGRSTQPMSPTATSLDSPNSSQPGPLHAARRPHDQLPQPAPAPRTVRPARHQPLLTHPRRPPSRTIATACGEVSCAGAAAPPAPLPRHATARPTRPPFPRACALPLPSTTRLPYSDWLGSRGDRRTNLGPLLPGALAPPTRQSGAPVKPPPTAVSL